MSTTEAIQVQASGTPLELLASDSRAPENRLFEHPTWVAVLDGTASKAKVRRLLLAFYPALAGRGRYAFAAKVSQISPEDGKQLFLSLYDTLKIPEANADTGWKAVLLALGATEREVTAALRQPSAEAEDLVDVIRDHGLRSGPCEASCISWMLERHLPRLWGQLASSLQRHYGVPKDSLAHLRYVAGRADKMENWVKHLVDTFVAPADPYTVFQGRRAAREAMWAWTVLTESVD